mmetsp:Transcript_58243/g.138749  ORF Transcript_58243/g.138749 Transcript_58243/m.138749 type:complete len:214 (+) Transcript_58243:394-1035(+)
MCIIRVQKFNCRIRGFGSLAGPTTQWQLDLVNENHVLPQVLIPLDLPGNQDHGLDQVLVLARYQHDSLLKALDASTDIDFARGGCADSFHCFATVTDDHTHCGARNSKLGQQSPLSEVPWTRGAQFGKDRSYALLQAHLVTTHDNHSISGAWIVVSCARHLQLAVGVVLYGSNIHAILANDCSRNVVWHEQLQVARPSNGHLVTCWGCPALTV